MNATDSLLGRTVHALAEGLTLQDACQFLCRGAEEQA
jgi:hypothetical protein